MAAAVPTIRLALADADNAATTSLDTLILSDSEHEPLESSERASLPPSSPESAALSTSSTRPKVERCLTEPPPANTASLPQHAKPNPKERTRNTSPFYRGHLRSQSAVVGSHNSLPMTRTQSLPLERTGSVFTSSPAAHSPARPSSPLRPGSSSSSSRRSYSPRRSIDEGNTLPGPGFSDIEIIAEDSELDLTAKPGGSSGSLASFAMHSNTFPRSNSGRRRPASPLVQQAVFTSASEQHSHQNQHQRPPSPLVNYGKFDEPFPGRLSFSSSSTPTTPTSFRSRSPSISSLETIPDTPDVVEEEAEREADNLAQLKAAADAADESESERKAAGRSASSGRDKKKRWSVCGAERRGDFEMETIWED